MRIVLGRDRADSDHAPMRGVGREWALSALTLGAFVALPVAAGAQDDAEASAPDEGDDLALLDSLPTSGDAGLAYSAVVHVDRAEVRAGAGDAYVSRGRAYDGDTLRVIRRTGDGAWLEVEVDGLRGWVRARAITLRKAGRVAPTDAGRSRRESNYSYDERGRRLRPDGTPRGSGEGTGKRAKGRPKPAPEPEPEAEPEPEPERPGRRGGPRRPSPTPEDVEGLEAEEGDTVDDGASMWRLSATVGFGQARRMFDSDIAVASALQHGEFQASGLLVDLQARATPLPYLAVQASLTHHATGSTRVPAAPDLGLNVPVEVGVGGLAVGLDAVGRYALSDDAAVEALVGARWWRQSVEATRPFPLFLTNDLTLVALGGGGEVALPLDLSLCGRAAYLHPVAESQSPVAGGALKSGSGFELAADLAWAVTPEWAVTLGGRVLRSRVERAGDSKHVDTHVDPPVGYTQARETQTIQGALVGARWTR